MMSEALQDSLYRGDEVSMDEAGVDEGPLACPVCGGTRIVPIIYGLPTESLFAKAFLGEVALGGCIDWGGAPAWQGQDSAPLVTREASRPPLTRGPA